MTPDTTHRLATVARYALAICGAALFMTAIVHAEEPSRYRTYELGTSLSEIMRATGARPADVKTRHERPSLVQVLEWRPPYTRRETTDADPVESIAFAFVDDRLYQMTIDYDRTRLASLTTADLVAGVQAVYGAPRSGRADAAAASDLGPEGTTVLGRWGDASSTVTLVRGPYEDIHLVVRSTSLNQTATRAIAAARAQDVTEGPARRAAEQATAASARSAERSRNRTAFKP